MTVKSSLLEMLEKNKGEVLSGESIAGELGCTRAAVWKAVKSLRQKQYLSRLHFLVALYRPFLNLVSEF